MFLSTLALANNNKGAPYGRPVVSVSFMQFHLYLGYNPTLQDPQQLADELAEQLDPGKARALVEPKGEADKQKGLQVRSSGWKKIS